MQNIIHTLHTYKITFLFFSFKNRFCKHCFRSFRFGSSTSLPQSVRFSIENSLRLLLWHLQMIFAICSSIPPLPTFTTSLQFSTHSKVKPQKEKKLDKLSGSSSVVMSLCGSFKMCRYFNIFKYPHNPHLAKKKKI